MWFRGGVGYRKDVFICFDFFLGRIYIGCGKEVMVVVVIGEIDYLSFLEILFDYNRFVGSFCFGKG